MDKSASCCNTGSGMAGKESTKPPQQPNMPVPERRQPNQAKPNVAKGQVPAHPPRAGDTAWHKAQAPSKARAEVRRITRTPAPCAGMRKQYTVRTGQSGRAVSPGLCTDSDIRVAPCYSPGQQRYRLSTRQDTLTQAHRQCKHSWSHKVEAHASTT